MRRINSLFVAYFAAKVLFAANKKHICCKICDE